MAGRYEIALSAKGRLKLRKHFTSHNDRVFLTKHVNEDGDCYLLGFSPRVWPRCVAEISDQKGEGKAFYLEAASELKIGARTDTIAIPSPLRDFAGLKRRVTLVEMGPGFDEFWLWDPKRHDDALRRIEKELLRPIEAVLTTKEVAQQTRRPIALCKDFRTR